jgi:hypothetical protein
LSEPFLLGITVFIVQITIFGLLAGDLINRFSENNPFGIPENVEISVRVTQFIAIIIASLSQLELLTSLEQVNEGYSQERIGKEFGEATCGKWWFATACRFWHGALGLFVTFLLIITEDNVFDLLLNFTAMEFVSKLDDAAFFLAGMGYFGSKNADKSEEIKETTYSQAAVETQRRRILHVLLLCVVFCGMLAGWGVIVNQQKSHKYCEQFFVLSPQTQLIDSGFYKLLRRNDARVQYILPDGFGFMFGYCEEERAWTYYLEQDGCANFIAKSAGETTTFDIRTTLFSPWISANLVPLDHIQFICADENGQSSGRFGECINRLSRRCGSASSSTNNFAGFRCLSFVWLTKYGLTCLHDLFDYSDHRLDRSYTFGAWIALRADLSRLV